MLQHVMIGQYVETSSLLHRLDPRTKIINVLFLFIIIFLSNNWYSHALLIFFTIGVIALSKIPLLFIYKGIRPILWLIFFTIILHLLMTREGDVLYTVGPLSIYEGGLYEGFFISIRLFTLFMFASLITLTTKPLELIDGLETLLQPFKKIGFPVHEFALMMSIALRFIPIIMQETEKIMKAQTARGASMSTGPIRKRMHALLSLLIPLFVSAFNRADDLAIAMEARGYRGAEGRSTYRILLWTKKDTFAVFVCVSFGIIIMMLRGI